MFKDFINKTIIIKSSWNFITSIIMNIIAITSLMNFIVT